MDDGALGDRVGEGPVSRLETGDTRLGDDRPAPRAIIDGTAYLPAEDRNLTILLDRIAELDGPDVRAGIEERLGCNLQSAFDGPAQLLVGLEPLDRDR